MPCTLPDVVSEKVDVHYTNKRATAKVDQTHNLLELWPPVIVSEGILEFRVQSFVDLGNQGFIVCHTGFVASGGMGDVEIGRSGDLEDAGIEPNLIHEGECTAPVSDLSVLPDKYTTGSRGFFEEKEIKKTDDLVVGCTQRLMLEIGFS